MVYAVLVPFVLTKVTLYVLAGFLVPLCIERKRKFKLLQYIYGLNPWVQWLICFLWLLIICFIMSWLILLLPVIGPLYNGPLILAGFLVIFISSLTMLPVVFLLTFCFGIGFYIFCLYFLCKYNLPIFLTWLCY